MDNIKIESDITILENSSDKYFCTLCIPTIAICSINNNSLELHIRELHPETTSIRCIYCSELVSSVSITKHIDRHFLSSDTQPYVCPVCPKTCDTLKSLAQHAMSLHQINQKDIFFKCGHCDQVMPSPSELKAHLSITALMMYHCCFPECVVKTRSRELLHEHLIRSHGSKNPLYLSTLSFTCSWPSALQPLDVTKLGRNSLERSKSKIASCFLCNQCSFGTIYLENFAQHLSSCRSANPSNIVASLSVTCVLYRCSKCNLTTNVRNILIEHIQDLHPTVPENEAIISEDFTVPLSDECISERYNLLANHINNLPNNSGVPQIANFPANLSPLFFNSANKVRMHARLRSLCSNPADLAACHSILSKAMDNRRMPNANEPHSIDSCEADEVGEGDDQADEENDDPNGFKDSRDDRVSSSKVLIVPHSRLPTETPASDSKTEIGHQVKTDEYVQLYFNEPAFVSAYMKSGKFTSTSKVAQQMELSSVLEKLRQFASYRVPILGRANQRRVAGCPECLKPFNHGFTDLKKHLMVTHLGIRRDISRFTIDFTHSSRNQYNTGICRPPEQRDNPSPRQQKHQPLNVRNGRLSTKQFRKKQILPLPLSNLLRCSFPIKSENIESSVFDSTNSTSYDNIPLVQDPNMTYSGGAPVHRVIPGTGVSDHCEDLRSLDEVSTHAPIGRGGIIPLDEMGNPIVAAMMAANQPQTSTYAGGTEIFLPKFGRQRIQLAYSLPVFKRLLEAYQVPMPERIQLINRMNHYGRMHVIMDVLVPGGAQKRFSCPTCMYTSVHSLADIRKHIMGSHCGISTKRFRLCLRASRHDTTTYRLHSDDRMIRFVEDHRRRQIQLADSQSNLTNSFDSDSEDTKLKTEETELITKIDDVQMDQSELVQPQPGWPNDQEELETQTIEIDPYESGQFDEVLGADEECDHRFLTADGVDQSPNQLKLLDDTGNEPMNAQSDDSSRSNEEFHRRIDLPYSKNVLHLLLEKEGMVEQFDDLVLKMEVYSKHYLTVVSRGNRIYAYICICGRRFAVVRDEIESDIRPASLADCRRHILGVHARIPQELLTLCCQASRISKESGYKLYADTSLLALAEQHKFRSSRIQTYARKLEDSISPSKRPLEPILPNDREIIVDRQSLQINSPINSAGTRQTTSQSNMNFTHSAPSQVAMRHSASYSTNHPLPPMLRAPNVKHESMEFECLSPLESGEVNGKAQTNVTSHNDLNNNRYEPPMNPYKKSVESGLFEDRSFALDLEVPRRIFSQEEAVMWSQKLNLPEAWTLERIVRLVYSPSVFDHQVRALLPDGDNFITSLHERMRVYSRHSVYITRSRDTPNPSQRIYVCCACLTTSHHGFGDVRKHILGVHAHVPERFKSAAMSSSRLNRDDYSLYTDSQLLQLATTPWRSAHVSSNKNSSPNGIRAIRRRFRQNEIPIQPKLSDNNSLSNKRRHPATFDDLPSLDPNSFAIEQSSIFEASMNSDHLNGHLSLSATSDKIADQSSEDYRPPIILTLSRPKAFQPSDNPEDSVCESFVDLEKSVDDLVGNDMSCSTGSRSRRSMILKSKRPCPTSI